MHGKRWHRRTLQRFWYLGGWNYRIQSLVLRYVRPRVNHLCIQLEIIVGFLQRNDNLDLTGDPWDARTLEWATSSPAPFYNFAHVPQADGIDRFWTDKENGVAYARPTSYEDVHMPTNRAAGFVIAMFITVMGFALIWHIWWLAAVGFIGAIVSFIVSSFTKEVDYYVPAAEVERIENERYAILEKHLKKD